MNGPFAVAGALALLAAAIHGGAGERLVVAKLQRDQLAPTPFGGPTMTKLMIRVTWHIVTLAFLVPGAAMAACSTAGARGACTGVGRLSAISFASFAVLALALAAATSRRVDRLLMKHPAPLIFVAIAVLAWMGSAR